MRIYKIVERGQSYKVKYKDWLIWRTVREFSYVKTRNPRIFKSIAEIKKWIADDIELLNEAKRLKRLVKSPSRFYR